MLKILKIKNESGKKMNQKEGAVFLLVLVLFGMHSFFYFFWYEPCKKCAPHFSINSREVSVQFDKNFENKSVLFGSNYLKMSSLVELSSENVLFGSNPL